LQESLQRRQNFSFEVILAKGEKLSFFEKKEKLICSAGLLKYFSLLYFKAWNNHRENPS
jgi:hypothetical protein